MDEDRPISGAASSFKESELPPSTSAYSIPDNIDAQEVPTAEDDIDNRPLEVRIADKNWKSRIAAYSTLESQIKENPSVGQTFLSFLTGMVSDSNNNALDAGVDCALAIFDLCEGHTVIPYSEVVVKNVVDKCFSSRTSTQSKGKQLVLKIMEISDPATACMALIEKFSDKRPKIPPLCIETILEGFSLFGASCFPLKELLKAIQPVFNSTNNAARDQALLFITSLAKWVGTAPILPMLENLRPAQKTEIEKVFSEIDFTQRPVPTLFLRKDRESGKSAENYAVLSKAKAGAVDGLDLVEEIDLAKKLKSGEYIELMKSEKWVEHSQGLQLIIDAIGPTPKLKTWSMTTDVVKGCKEYMTWGHLQVQSKALKLLTLFSLGLKSKFAVDGRSIMPFVLMKAKEKKVVDDVEEACVTMFKNSFSVDPFVEDICEQLKSKKSPTHSKICMQHIIRYVIENTAVQPDNIRVMIDTVSNCAEDSDPKVRESTIQVLGALYQFSQTTGAPNREVGSILGQYQTSRSKLYLKMISSDNSNGGNESASTSKPMGATSAKSAAIPASTASNSSQVRPGAKAVTSEAKDSNPPRPSANGAKKQVAGKAGAKEDHRVDNIPLNFELTEGFGVGSERADQVIAELLADESAAVNSGLIDAKWQSKVEAIGSIGRIITASATIEEESLKSALLYVSGATTKFRVSNMNIVKACMELGSVICSKTSSKVVVAAIIDTFADKLSDKKMVPIFEDILRKSIVSVGAPFVVSRMNSLLDPIKAPLAHQHYLAWAKQYISDNGVQGLQLNNIAAFLVKELENKQGSIRSAAIEVLAEIYHYLGPPFQALLNGFEIPAPAKASIEAEFNKIGYDPTLSKKATAASGQAASSDSSIPRVDLSNVLDKTILTDLGCVEGKDSWQVRKAAIEKITGACESSAYYVDMNRFIPDLLKALKARFLDTQSNLRPLALGAVAKIVISLDDESAIKAIRATVGAILTSVSDTKKVIKDAAIAALECILVGSDNQPRPSRLHCMIPNMSEWIVTSAARVDVLLWLNTHLDCFAGADVAEMVPCLVESLQDKNSVARVNAEQLLSHFMQNGLITPTIFDRSVRDLPTATKKAIQPFIDRVLAKHLRAPPSVHTSQETSKAAIVNPVSTQQVQITSAVTQPVMNQVVESQPEVKVVPRQFHQASHKEPEVARMSYSIPVVSAGSKMDRLRSRHPHDGDSAEQLCSDWFGPNKTESANLLFGSIMPDEASHVIVSWVQDPRFIHQSDLVFRWFGLQFTKSLLQGGILDRYLHQLTLFMDGLRSLPKAVKQQLDFKEVSYFLPKILKYCKNLTDLQRQNCSAIVSCCSDCFSPAAISMHLLEGLDSPHIDCRRLCLNETLRLTENVGFEALGRDSLKKMSEQWDRVSKSDPSFALFQRLAVSFAESVDCDARKLVDLYPADLFDLKSLQKFVILDGVDDISGSNDMSEFEKLTVDDLFTRLNELLLLSEFASCTDSLLREMVYYAEKDASFFSNLLKSGLSEEDLVDNVQLGTTIIERLVSQNASKSTLTSQILLSCLVTIVQRLLPYSVSSLDAQNAHKLLADLLEASRRVRTCSIQNGIQHALHGLLIQISFGVDSVIFFECVTSLVTSSSWLRKPILRLLQAFVDRKVYNTRESRSLDQLLKIVEKCEKLVHGAVIVSSATVETHTLLVKLVYQGLKDIYGENILIEVLEQVAPNSIVLFAPSSPVSQFDSESVTTSFNENLPPANNQQSKEVSKISTESVEKVLALVNEITVSRDKSSSIKELYLLKKRDPSLDIEKYLDKLSSTFRRYVLDEFSRLDLQDSHESAPLSILNSPDVSSEGAEALRIIENLKSARPIMSSLNADVDTSVDTSADTVPDLSFSAKRLSRSFSGVSPFARRNEKIRDSLNNLSRTLELPNLDGDLNSSQSLEERLSMLKSMK